METRKRIETIIKALDVLEALSKESSEMAEDHVHPYVGTGGQNENEIMVYNKDYFWEICEELEIMPLIEHLQPELINENDELHHQAHITFQGTNIHIYLRDGERRTLQKRCDEWTEKQWQELAAEQEDSKDA